MLNAVFYKLHFNQLFTMYLIFFLSPNIKPAEIILLQKLDIPNLYNGNKPFNDSSFSKICFLFPQMLALFCSLSTSKNNI